jgi:hypothetical protein
MANVSAQMTRPMKIYADEVRVRRPVASVGLTHDYRIDGNDGDDRQEKRIDSEETQRQKSETVGYGIRLSGAHLLERWLSNEC